MQAVKSLQPMGLALLGALLLGASPAMAGKAETAEQKVAKAQSLVTKVRNETDDWGLWKSTRKVLGNAEQSLKQGDHEAATKAAEKAIFEAKKGLAQFRDQKQNYDNAADSAASNGSLKEDAWTQGES